MMTPETIRVKGFQTTLEGGWEAGTARVFADFSNIRKQYRFRAINQNGNRWPARLWENTQAVPSSSLTAPLQEVEVVHAVGSAVLDWMEEQRQGQVR